MKLTSFSRGGLKAYLVLCLGLGAFVNDPAVYAQNPTPVAQSQSTFMLTGTVKDSAGEPIIGANVIIVGNPQGTTTNLDGEFTLPASINSKIKITYVGYAPQEFVVKDANPVTITLQESNLTLEDVVVVGYGTQKKADLTGAVVRADLNSFKHAPNSNVLQSLQGVVPGLNLGIATSAGGSPSMSIRGNNTLNGNSDVLIVLDGIIYTSSLSSINPDDIESIDILKDASSTAVYGAQAANGVILITTKKGSTGKPLISFTTNYTISNPTHNYRPMNRDEYMDEMHAFYYKDAFMGPDYTKPNPDFDVVSKLPDSALRDGYAAGNDYSWWDEGTQKGHLWETRLSISGGSNQSDYYISYSHTDQAGFIKNDNFIRNTIRMNINTHLASWWTVGVQAFGSFVNQDGAEPDLGTLIHQSPLITPYDDNGKIKPFPFNTLDQNPFMGSDINDYERHNYFSGLATTQIQFPLKGLSYRLNYGINYHVDKYNRANEYGYNLQGEAYKNFSDSYDYTLDNILSYSNTFGIHKVDATLLYGASERKYSATQAKSQGFTRLTLGFNSLEQGTNQYASSDAWHESLNYQMARLSYRLMNKYLLTATVRRDGFSAFASNHKYATFPSVSLGWIISDEDFFKVPCINYLKVRGGYGISGNQTSRYKSQSRVLSELHYIFGDGGTPVIGQEMSALGNNDLRWEKSKGYNLGLDFALFHQRLTGSIEFYNTTTKDLLYDVVIPNITGFSSISSNIGQLRNRGFELSLTSQNIVNKDFTWTSTLAFSTNSNKIVTLTGEDNDGDGVEDNNIASNLFIGHSIGTVYGYKVDGIYQIGDEDIPEGFNPGNYRIIDTNDDGKISPDDRIILGKTEPAFRTSLMNNFRYKNISLSFLINAVQGGKNGYLGSNSSSLIRDDNNMRWNHLNAYDYWSPSNPNATFARSDKSPRITPTVYEDRSFVRLQDVQLSYSFPKALLSKCYLQSLEVFFSAKNLVTLTKWHGWDPEANSTYWGRPVMRSFSFGLSVTY